MVERELERGGETQGAAEPSAVSAQHAQEGREHREDVGNTMQLLLLLLELILCCYFTDILLMLCVAPI